MIQVEDANTLKLNKTTSSYLEEFQDKETRHIYVDEFLNAKIATQIKVLREQQGWTQAELAERTGMKQTRISLLEDVNYTAWTLQTLRKLAEAFDLRINVSFEDFGSFLKEFTDFNRENLERTSFEKDPVFKKKSVAKNIKPFPTKLNINLKELVDALKSITPFTVTLPYQPELSGLGFVLVSNNDDTSNKIIETEEKSTSRSVYKSYSVAAGGGK